MENIIVVHNIAFLFSSTFNFLIGLENAVEISNYRDMMFTEMFGKE